MLIFVVYPVYSRLGVTTSYDYIAVRFGEGPRKVVAGLFLLARLGWLGTVVFAPALALSLATGMPTWTCRPSFLSDLSELSKVTRAPSPSIETWAPPPVRARPSR